MAFKQVKSRKSINPQADKAQVKTKSFGKQANSNRNEKLKNQDKESKNYPKNRKQTQRSSKNHSRRDNRQSRGNYNRRENHSNWNVQTKEYNTKPQIEHIDANLYSQDYQEKVFVIDEEEFYGLTVDLVLYNFKFSESVKVSSVKQLEKMLSEMENHKFSKNTYIISDLMTESEISEVRVIEKIKQKDPESKILVTTTIKDLEDLPGADHVIVKSGRDNSRSLIKVISEIFNLEFVMDNSDPEYE